jgi:hypothetical protein
MMIQPLYGSITLLEDRKSLFYMCAVMTDRICDEMNLWASNHAHTPYACELVRLLKENVPIRLAPKNHDV